MTHAQGSGPKFPACMSQDSLRVWPKIRDKIYVVGGGSEGEIFNSVESYSMEANVWATKARGAGFGVGGGGGGGLKRML